MGHQRYRQLRCLALVALLFVSLAHGRYYSNDGKGVREDDLGAAGDFFTRRRLDGDFEDDISLPIQDRPNSRDISNALCMGELVVTNPFAPPSIVCPRSASGVAMNFESFGQFKSHDYNKIPLNELDPTSGVRVPIFPGDQMYDDAFPAEENYVRVLGRNSIISEETGQAEFVNAVTGFFDLSQTYGSSDAVNSALRDPNSGRMLLQPTPAPYGVSYPDFPPTEVAVGFPQNPQIQAVTFAYGDNRGNENALIQGHQVVWVRNHNRIYDILKLGDYAGATEDVLYEEARRLNVAQYQKVLYEEWAPVAFGATELRPYRGYRRWADPRTSLQDNLAFRGGHSGIDNTDLRSPDGNLVSFTNPFAPPGSPPSTQLFFANQHGGPAGPLEYFNFAGNLTNIMYGATTTRAGEYDLCVSEELRSIVNQARAFGVPGAGNDLVCSDIENGYTVGTQNYYFHRLNSSPLSRSETRVYGGADCRANHRSPGPDPMGCWEKLAYGNVEVAETLASYYQKITEVPLFVGILMEPLCDETAALSCTAVGIHKKELEMKRDGDPLFYLNTLSQAELDFIRSENYGDIFQANGLNADFGSVFRVPEGY